jgi:hypothetical protein
VEQHPGYPVGAPYAVAFAGIKNGIAVGGPGLILQTNDIGTTWKSIESGTWNTLRAIAYVAENTWVAVGDGGTILRSKIIERPTLAVPNDMKQQWTGVALMHSVPNPATGVVHFEIAMPENRFTRLTLVSSTGENVITLVSRNLSAGKHSLEWDTHALPSGLYLYRLETFSGESQTSPAIETGKIIVQH